MAANEWISARCHGRCTKQGGQPASWKEIATPLRHSACLGLLLLAGCTVSRVSIHSPQAPSSNVAAAQQAENSDNLAGNSTLGKANSAPNPSSTSFEDEPNSDVQLTSGVFDTPIPPAPGAKGTSEESENPADAPKEVPAGPTGTIALDQVVDAIYQSYPLLQMAYFERNIALGDNISAQGEFDFKLKTESGNTPEGFYQTYRNSVGFDQPLYGGGNVFGGYRIGRGSFEPWYLERQTNDGGEFKLGLSLPLLQNRTIDERRAQLWRTAYGRDLVEPEIRVQLLQFIREGSIAYWEWVGAGQHYHYAERLLSLAQDRDEQLRRRVREGRIPESFLTDNERLIVSRRVKRLDALRKLETAAAKLSLFLRMPDGAPYVPPPELLPSKFPDPQPVNSEFLLQDIAFAQERRPELAAFDVMRQMLHVDLSQAQNLLQPELNAVIVNSQDVGGPTSSKGDKTPFELQAGVFMTVPVQRNKARGKIAAIEGKLAQLNAKRQFTSDKISVEVRTAVISLDTAYQATSQAREAVRLNEEMERFEVIKLDQGDSDFLLLNLREQATFDALVAEVDALLRYYEAQAEYRAAVAADIPEQQ